MCSELYEIARTLIKKSSKFVLPPALILADDVNDDDEQKKKKKSLAGGPVTQAMCWVGCVGYVLGGWPGGLHLL
jgi:hypothetical protein